MKRLILLPIFLLPVISLFPQNSFADKIYLKNGSSFEGIVENETKDGVDIHLGYGTMTFSRGEIKRIEKSKPEEMEKLWEKWGQEQKDVERRKPEEERKRKERETEAERLRLEQEKLKKEKDEFAPKEITVYTRNGSIYVNVLLNGSVRANLVLDSGAVIVTLSKRLAGELGIDLTKLEKSAGRVADGRTIEEARGTLQSIKVQNYELKAAGDNKKPGVEAPNVDVGFILDETPVIVHEGGDVQTVQEDGLLGMSFLKNFKFNADYANKKIAFEKLKPAAGENAQ